MSYWPLFNMYGDPQGAEQSLQLKNSTELYRKREIQRHHISSRCYNLIWKGANEERVRVAAAGGKAGRGGKAL